MATTLQVKKSLDTELGIIELERGDGRIEGSRASPSVENVSSITSVGKDPREEKEEKKTDDEDGQQNDGYRVHPMRSMMLRTAGEAAGV